MAAKDTQRDKIVRAAADLLRRRGYAATGLSDIIAASGAPKGSLYHYFPAGKDQIAAAALRYAGELLEKTLVDIAAKTDAAADILRVYAALLAGWMAQSGFRDGCPITTTVLETAPEKAEIAEAGRDAFARWRAPLERRLVEQGVAPTRALALAQFAIMSLEGALVLARVEASEAPILLAAEEAAALFEREAGR